MRPPDSSRACSASFHDAGLPILIAVATVSGDVSRIGTPRAAEAGDDSTAATPPSQYGLGNENSTTGTVGTANPLTLMGWRQVF